MYFIKDECLSSKYEDITLRKLQLHRISVRVSRLRNLCRVTFCACSLDFFFPFQLRTVTSSRTIDRNEVYGQKGNSQWKNESLKPACRFYQIFFSLCKNDKIWKTGLFLCFSKMKEYVFGCSLQFHWACRIIRVPLGQALTLETKQKKQQTENNNNNKFTVLLNPNDLVK